MLSGPATSNTMNTYFSFCGHSETLSLLSIYGTLVLLDLTWCLRKQTCGVQLQAQTGSLTEC